MGPNIKAFLWKTRVPREFDSSDPASVEKKPIPKRRYQANGLLCVMKRWSISTLWLKKA